MSASPPTPSSWHLPAQEPDPDELAFEAFASRQDPVVLAAARWVARQRDGLDQQGRSALQAWLDADLRHRAAFDEMAGLLATVRQAEPEDIAALRTGLPSHPANCSGLGIPPTARRRPAPSVRIALVTLALVVIGWVGWSGWSAWRQWPLFEQTYATGRGQHLSITLADGEALGSRMHLDTASLAVVRLYRDRREVDLKEGQAQFQVTSDTARPFHVQAGAVRITVVGTRFSVRHTDTGLAAGQTVISVEEGKVSVRRHAAASRRGDSPASADPSGDAGEALLLVAGQQTVADAAGAPGPIVSLPPAAMAAWRDGRISFDQTPLGDAIAEFERYGRSGLVVRDPTVAALLVGGSYRPGQARRFAETLPRMLPVRLERRGEVTEVVAK